MDSLLGRTKLRPSIPHAACLATLSIVAVLTGCSPVKKDKMATSLQTATNGYQAALRWGYYENAYGYVAPKKRQDKEISPTLEDIRLTGYDVVQPPVMKSDSDTAMQVVKIEYLHTSRQVVKTLIDRQLWHYDEEAKQWWLESGLPAFK